MTDAQYALLIGTIYVVPSLDKSFSVCIGLGLMIAASLKGLGWI